MIKTLNSLDKGGNVVDLTSATTDYPLAIGETATLSYSSATSVPLHIATVEGLYEMVLIDTSLSSVNYTNNTTYLLPNNSAVTAGAINYERISQYGTTLNAANDISTFAGFAVSRDTAGIYTKADISTFKGNKVLHGVMVLKIGADATQQIISAQSWMDTTTSWSSLDTLAFTLAQSGKIVIRRIV